jgi:hypothetical protein
MRIVGTFLIAVLLMATFARAALPGMPQASCSGDLVAADVCPMPGLPSQSPRPATKFCCAALPDFAGHFLPVAMVAGQRVPGPVRAGLLPDRAGAAGPWRPPRA